MSNFFHLLKISLIENFRLNKLFNKDKIILKVLFILFVVVLVGILAFSIGTIYYTISFMASDSNDSIGTILNTAFSLVAVMMIVSTLAQSKGFLFKGNDFDLLVSMPIKLKDIVLSKISTLLIANYLVMLLGFVPAIVVIAIQGLSTQAIFYIIAVLIFLLFPLAILSIFSLIALFVSNIFRNLKYKNLLIIALVLSLLTLYFIFVFSVNNDNIIFLQMGNSVKYIYYPAVLAINGLLGNFIHLGLFVVFNVVLIVVFINIVGKLYLKINTGFIRKAKKNNKTLTIEKSSQTRVLIKNEFKKYFSIPQYVINTIFGKILLPVGMILATIQMSSIETDPTLPLDISELVYLILGLIAVFTVTLASTTSVTISLEGKQLWILKTIPVSTKQIFMSKMAVDMSTTLLGAVIALIGVAIILPFNLISFGILAIFVLLLGIHNAVLGLIINLKFPKLKWDLPVRVVKQSLSVALHMILSFVLVILLVVGLLLLSQITNSMNLIFAILTIFVLLLVVSESLLLNKFGDKWFIKLQE